MEQLTDTLLMMRPANFGYNPETAESNPFQHVASKDVSQIALSEFDDSVDKIRAAGIEVLVFEGNNPEAPDEIFPNWLSTYSNGTIVLSSMMAKNRRIEKRNDIIGNLKSDFKVYSVLDFSVLEKNNHFLEGTGSLVLDRISKVAYATISERTSVYALVDLCTIMGYKPVIFETQNREGKSVYHTDLMMSIGQDFTIFCYDLLNKEDKAKVEKSLYGHNVIEISMEQFEHMAGNVLQVKNKDGKKYFIASENALNSYTPQQLSVITNSSTIIALKIPTIEEIGGGSARCLLGDLYLKKS